MMADPAVTQLQTQVAQLKAQVAALIAQAQAHGWTLGA